MAIRKPRLTTEYNNQMKDVVKKLGELKKIKPSNTYSPELNKLIKSKIRSVKLQLSFLEDILTSQDIGLMEKGTLSARGWHKDHYNYNKAEKHELPPSLRRTPARNVTRTGAKRKRATSIKKYKR
jgi:hypothetical protein